MATTFIPFSEQTMYSQWRINDPFKGAPPPPAIFLQWVPAKVISNIPVRSHAANPHGHTTNGVIAIPYIGRSITSALPATMDSPEHLYIPLLRGINDLPLPGDCVLTTTINQTNYFLGPLNINNNPNDTRDEYGTFMQAHIHKLKMEDKVSTHMPGPSYNSYLDSSTFLDMYKDRFSDEEWEDMQKRQSQELAGYAPNFAYRQTDHLGKVPKTVLDNPKDGSWSDEFAQYFFGYDPDMVMEGRNGNSIRIGSRDSDPYIIISNGRNMLTSYESMGDSSLFSMTEYGNLMQHFGGHGNYMPGGYEEGSNPEERVNQNLFSLSCDLKYDFKKPGLRGLGSQVFDPENREKSYYDPVWRGGQAFLQSKKITFNSTDTHLTLSSWTDILLGSGRDIRIHSEKKTIIDAESVCLGQPTDISTGDEIEMEPMVLGESLRLLLNDLVNVLLSFSVGGVPNVMYSGGLNPATKTELEGILARLKEPNDGKVVVDWLSKYHKIEKNTGDVKDTIESLKAKAEENQNN